MRGPSWASVKPSYPLVPCPGAAPNFHCPSLIMPAIREAGGICSSCDAWEDRRRKKKRSTTRL